MGMMIVVAGGLHWYFYMRRGQGKRLKFDARDQAKGNRLWNFSNQVHDNMFWSLTSGVAQLTAYQVLTMWLMANGYAPTITFAAHPIWFIAGLDPDSNLVCLPFLLGAPAAACAHCLQTRARAAPPQCQRRSLVGSVDAPG